MEHSAHLITIRLLCLDDDNASGPAGPVAETYALLTEMALALEAH